MERGTEIAGVAGETGWYRVDPSPLRRWGFLLFCGRFSVLGNDRTYW